MSGFHVLVDYMVRAALLLTALQLYLTIKKLWKRKHERAVADSISILGEFVGLIPVTVFTLKFTLDGEWEGATEGGLWIFGAVFAVLIGTGRWVESRRGRGMFTLIRESIHQERGEVGYLARSFMRPSGATHILQILGRVALLDDHLDDREKDFVESFARSWGIQFRWEDVPAAPGDDPLDFLPLRQELEAYLATSPPPAQVQQLAEVLHVLVNIDQSVTQSESLMMAELDGMVDAFLKTDDGKGLMYAVVLVPQGQDQDRAIATVLPDLAKRELNGGQVYIAGNYHSFDFAEIVAAQYRALNFFTAVVRTEGRGQAVAT
ncbi:MAG: hypothetical protein ABIV28_00575 [Longimicrobiales bacterium]